MINLGAIGEAAFALSALEKGYEICVPHEHISSYDFILKTKKGWKRIQVKTTSVNRSNIQSYEVNCRQKLNGKDCKYTEKEADFIVVYIFNHAAFYVIPVKEVTRQYFRLYPMETKRNKYNKFKEAWNLLEV